MTIQEIGEQRQKEIAEGEDYNTAFPLYVVYSSTRKMGDRDRADTHCFTRQAANEYMVMNRHNLKKPYIIVEHIPAKNVEMRAIIEMLGGK